MCFSPPTRFLHVRTTGSLLCSHTQLATPEPGLGAMDNWAGCTRRKRGSDRKLGAEDVKRQQAGKRFT